MKEHRCQFSLIIGMIFSAAQWLRADIPAAAHSFDELREQLAAHIEAPRFNNALWGVKIVSLDSGEILFEHHADRLMSPASNSKLYTGALGLDRLGGDYRIGTPLYAIGEISDSGTLRGNLVVVGHGDPSWNARRMGTNFWTVFEPFATMLTNAGVHRITGDLIADATFFRGPPAGSSWTIDDLDGGETGLISPLTVADNLVQVRVEPGAKIGAPCRFAPMLPGTGLVFSNQLVTAAADASAHLEIFHPLDAKTIFLQGQLPFGGAPQFLDVAVSEPADWFAQALKYALARHGIGISGRARSVTWPQPPTEIPTNAIKLGTLYSPPLRAVVRSFMKPSQNLETDLLLAHVGEMSRTNFSSRQTSEDAGLAALKQFLAGAGVAPDDVQFDEGSGLSRNNLTTANATVTLLQFMAKHNSAQDFINALPIAGVDGTLARRMRGTPAYQNVRAKTGTLRWVNALSGYVTTAAGEHLVFSLMLNRYEPPADRKRTDELDDIAVMLAQFAGRSDDSLEKIYVPLGTLLVGPFANAPFPHPARTAGHKYHNDFYSAAEHYSDSTVAMFIPKNFRASDKIDFVVHFHGWNNNVPGTLAGYKLIEQFCDSDKNAVLVVPEGPHNAPDSFGGKLEDTNGFKIFMAEAAEKLRANGALGVTNFDIGNVIISGHSGGYHVMSAILDHGGLSDKIREAWLFDALYGGTENFVAWQKKQNGKLLNIYTDHGGTKEETENLAANYKTNSVIFFAAEDMAAAPDNLATNKIIFLHTDMVHNDVVAKRGTFEQFLKASCLENK